MSEDGPAEVCVEVVDGTILLVVGFSSLRFSQLTASIIF